MYYLVKEPIIKPKSPNPEKELILFLEDIENTIKELKMEKPVERFLAYVITYDFLMQLALGNGSSEELFKSNRHISVLKNSIIFNYHGKKEDSEKLIVKQVGFEEWLFLRINLRDENFSYMAAMVIIKKKMRETIQKDSTLKTFSDLSDYITRIIYQTKKGN